MGLFSKGKESSSKTASSRSSQGSGGALASGPKFAGKGVQPGRKDQSDAVGSVVGEGTVIVGELKSDRDVVVHGTVKGSVKVGSDLIVAETGVVEAQVEAENVSVGGRLKGTTVVRNLFELCKTGTIEGEVFTKRVKIDEGGRMIGKIDMTQGSVRASADATGRVAAPSKKEGISKEEMKVAAASQPSQAPVK